MNYLTVILILFFYQFPLQHCFADTIYATVTKVYDGDTVTLEGNIKVRLEGIDTPEIRQQFGKQSRDFLRGLVDGQKIKVTWTKKDRYKRIIGTIHYQGENINLTMIISGYAWHYKKYNQNASFADAETNARNGRIGLWKSGDAVPPWLYRRYKKNQRSREIVMINSK